jgi:hypothetical protein
MLDKRRGHRSIPYRKVFAVDLVNKTAVWNAFSADLKTHTSLNGTRNAANWATSESPVPRNDPLLYLRELLWKVLLHAASTTPVAVFQELLQLM